MARHPYGVTPADWAFDVAIDNLTPQLSGGTTLTFFSLQTGGVQYTDLLDSDGVTPITAVVSSTGSDGYVVGTVPLFFGPDAITSMWMSAAGGPRVLMSANDAEDRLDDVAGRLADLENTVENLVAVLNLAAIVWPENNDNTWSPRPGNAGTRTVFWKGGDTPPAGGGYMDEGDIYLDTSP